MKGLKKTIGTGLGSGRVVLGFRISLKKLIVRDSRFKYLWEVGLAKIGYRMQDRDMKSGMWNFHKGVGM